MVVFESDNLLATSRSESGSQSGKQGFFLVRRMALAA
jgi:hypothetical protein